MASAPLGDDGWDDGSLSPWPSAEEVAYAAALAAADRAEDAASAAAGECSDTDPDGDWSDVPDGYVPLSDADLVEGLAGPAEAVDLLLLDSIDPATLAHPLDRLAYLQGLDRVAALVAAKQVDTVAAIAGDRGSDAYLDEVHLEHELALARRTSRYAAGRAVETARGLRTRFPAFLTALRAGEISAGHVAVLADRTRFVTDQAAFARIEARVLPKARRTTPGEFGTAVAKAVARYDRDAAARLLKARETRRMTVRQLEDGLGHLGLVHDWATIHAIAHGGHRRRPTPARHPHLRPRRTAAPGVAVVDGVDEVGADACRADALAARILGTINPDGSVSWDRDQVQVSVTARHRPAHPPRRGREPVPARRATRPRRDRARPGRLRPRLAAHDHRPGHRAPARLRPRHLPARTAAHLRPRPRRRLPRPRLHHQGPAPPPARPRRPLPARTQQHHQHRWGVHRPATSSKPTGHVCITDTTPDGSCLWRTAWGQAIHIPPRAYLDDPEPEPDPPPPQPPPEQTPPF